MYSEEFVNPITVCLAKHTDHMRNVRNHIPAGPQYFHFYKDETELNWYEFWEAIGLHKPFSMRLNTNVLDIHFDVKTWKWIPSRPMPKDITATAELLCAELNAYEEKAQLLRQFQNVIKTEDSTNASL